jgi:signal transduction histidine kinase
MTTPQTDTATPFSQLLARYERIIEISQQLNSTLDHLALLRKIISAAIELLNCEAASILLLDPSTGELRFELSSNISTHEMETLIVPLEGSIAGWVVTHGEPRVIQDASRERGVNQQVGETLNFETRSLLAVPMRAHSKVIGTLEAVNKRGGEFNDEDIKTLLTLASHAAVAIENSRLFQQSDFMAEMVHELRQPLAALKLSATALLRSDLPSEKREDMIQTMQGETDRLIHMTTDFLDLSRWESGRGKLELSRFDLLRVITECIDIVTPQGNERGISISLESEPFTVNGDRGKVKQVVLNLMTNAVKYNKDNGQIFITTRVSPEHETPFVEISVRDTGRGIAKENQKNMFQKFYRAEDSAKGVQGTGLGLAITKHIVEAHNGHIWLDSDRDAGSTFFITLPIASKPVV